jgi:cytochrome c oxidase assembly protein subunit 15
MFLYPFSRMTGDIYYEHAHRLFGALVGLTTLVMAISLQRLERRRWVRALGWFALAMVVAQGILGGLRVTGQLTLSTSPEAMAPNLGLAMVHGVFAQLFFATLVALGSFTSATWRSGIEPLRRAAVRADRILVGLLVVLIGSQLVLGAAQRHFHQLLMFHVVLGVAVVAPLGVNAGIRAWTLNRGRRLLQRLGLALVAAVCVQLILGFGAFAALESAGSLTVRTTHQWFGAVLLALAVTLLCWSFRLLSPSAAPPKQRQSAL